MEWIWVAALAGALVGLIGGLIGTYNSYRQARGPRERALVLRFALAAFTGIGVFIAAMLSIPQPYNMWLWLPYALALPAAVRYFNRRLAEIRAAESNDASRPVR